MDSQQTGPRGPDELPAGQRAPTVQNAGPPAPQPQHQQGPRLPAASSEAAAFRFPPAAVLRPPDSRSQLPPGQGGQPRQPLGFQRAPPPRNPVPFFGLPPQPTARFPGVRAPPQQGFHPQGFPGRAPFGPQIVRGPRPAIGVPPPPPPPPPPPQQQQQQLRAQMSVEGTPEDAESPESRPADEASVEGFEEGRRKPLSSPPPPPPPSGRKHASFADEAGPAPIPAQPPSPSPSPSPPLSGPLARPPLAPLTHGDFSSTDAENDSGLDGSRRRRANEANGLQAGSPTKSPSKSVRSLPRTPDPGSPSAAQTASAERKKVPMNKVQVGAAPSPNLKAVRSKIGSLDNTTYKPGGGKVKIENRKLDFSKAQPKIAAKNEKYTPSGGDKKIQQVKLQWNAKPKIGSLENAAYKPGGGDKKIETVKLDFKDKAKPKVGSKENAKHVPGGGAVKSTATPPRTAQDNADSIETQKIDIKAESKVGSLDNVKHKPGGGEKKIFDDKTYLRQTSSSNVASLSGSGSQSPIPSGTGSISDKNGLPISDENLNQES